MRQQASPGVLLPPIILTTVIFVVAYLFRPSSATPADRTDYEYFFSAAAAVLGTILIAIVLQANLFQGTDQRRMLIYGLLYMALAEAAALTALLPGESDHLRGVLFGLTASAGIGALSAVVYIAVRILEAPAPELEIQADGSAVIEDPDDDEAQIRARIVAVRQGSDPDRQAAERQARRDPTRAGRPGRPGPEAFVVLHPDAVADLEKLGRRESALVLAITERILGRDRAREKRAVRLDDEWSELRAGGLRIVFRPLTREEAAEHGRQRGSLVRRILAEDTAREWLHRAASYERGADDRSR